MSETHAQTVSYVRTEMLGEQAPPVAEAGAIKWLRENLFSSWLNILLTVISIFVIYQALMLVLPWAFGGVWNAGSLTECREVLFAFYKGSHDGACWAVIEDRWLQIMFGFYPPELYWRPILAFVLFFVALAPVLFADKVPGQIIWFSLAYPFIATWLIWGGSVWAPILAALGFIIGFVILKVLGRLTGPIVANLGALAAALLWWGVAMTPINDSINKMIGSSRLDATVTSLEQQAEALPVQIANLKAEAEQQQAVIAEVEQVKNDLLETIAGIRIEEFAIEAQIEPKEVALQRLDAAEESLADLAGVLDEWNGSPSATAATLDDESEIAAAQEDAAEAASLIGDVNSLLGNAINDINDDTAEPAEIAETLVANAATKDPSILNDVDSMVSKATLVDPLAAIAEQTAGLDENTPVDEIATVRAAITTVMASLQANLDTLNTVHDKIIATNVEDLKAPQAALLAQTAQMASLRDEATVVAQEVFRLETAVSDGRRFLTALRSLDEREAMLPVLRERVADLRAALPSNQRNMIAVTQLPEDATTAEEEALSTYLDTRTQELSVQASVRDTYNQLGLVGLAPIDSRQIGGFMLALIIGIAGIVLSLPLGILLALGRQSHLFIVNKICVTFIEVIRGVPLIVWLFTASILLNYFLPPGTSFDLMLRVIIMVTLFASAYIAEVIRGGLAALPTGQYEGADSLGLSYWQSMQLIILPQAMKISIPGIVNTFIGLFKDTVLVVFIGLSDPIGFSNLIRADTDWNGIYWELFAFIGVLFFIFCFGMGRYSIYLEKKLQREHR